jgi:glycosyltransferase involved in cell wall biosynthesis
MKLLVLSNNPDRASFRQRIGIYLDHLRTEGIATSVNKLPKNYIERWKLFASSANYDGVLLHKKTLNYFDTKILRKHAKKIIYDFDDAIMFSPNKPQDNNTSHYRLFKRTAGLADHIIAGNDYLAGYAKKYNDSVVTIPTGLEFDDYQYDITKPNDGKIRLVWIGSRSTLKYLYEIKAALEYTGEDYDNVILRIIADEFFKLDNMLVEEYQWSKETQAENLMECDIGLAPLPDDRFTRGKCGFKILQYYAASLPVVASPVGVNKDFIEKSKGGIIAENFDNWVQALSKLIEDEPIRTAMGKYGKDYVRNFDCQVIKEKLAKCLLTFLGN